MTAPVDEHLDHMLDAVRVVEAVLHGDDASFNAVLQTTTCSPTKMVLALATILACAPPITRTLTRPSASCVAR